MEHTAAWTLILGAAAFFVGAGLAPEPSRVFSGDRAVYLRVLHEHHHRWLAMNGVMIVGVVLTAAGLVDAASLVGQPFAVAAVTYLVAAVLWVAVMVARSTVDITVADRVAAGQDDLAGYELWSAATGGWFRVHLLLAYAAVTVAGVALLRDSSVPAWVGWTAVGLGLVAGIGNATGQPRTKAWGPLFEPPFMVHIPTLVIGIGLLMAS